jgi:hypothetical protein
MISKQKKKMKKNDLSWLKESPEEGALFWLWTDTNIFMYRYLFILYICIYTYIYTYLYTYVYTYIYTCMYTCIGHIIKCISIPNMHSYIYTYKHMHRPISFDRLSLQNTMIYIYIYRICIYTYTCVYTYTCIYIYMLVFINTDT